MSMSKPLRENRDLHGCTDECIPMSMSRPAKEESGLARMYRRMHSNEREQIHASAQARAGDWVGPLWMLTG